MRKIFTLLFCAASLATGLAQQESYFTNPVIHGDVADPSIIRIDQTYYITGTSSEWAPYYPVFTSTDLVNWQQTGHVFDEKPEWTKSSFWAPEWYQHKGKVYVYYTARKQSDNISCIGVAVADSPTGKFKDYGPVVEFGKEAIDAFILEDKGKLYISWKAYGLDNQPIELLACKLTDDGLRLDGKPFSLLRDDERQGMEGQHWFKKDGYYYIIYSVRGCCGPQSDYLADDGTVLPLHRRLYDYTATITPRCRDWSVNTEQLERLRALAERCQAEGVRLIVVLPPMAENVRTEVCDAFGISDAMEDEVLPALRAWADSYGFTLLDYEWGGSCITDDDTQFFDGFHLDEKYGLPLWTEELFNDIK